MPIINLLSRVIISGKSRNKTLLFVGVLFILISSCTSDKKNDDSPPLLFSPPKTVPLNTSDGYKINQLTGDSIQSLINSLGDAVISGVPIPAVGKYIHPDSVAKPRVIPAGKPEVVQTSTNVHLIPDKLTIVSVDESKLKKFVPGEINSSFVLVNSIGDTIPTGIPIPVKGRVVPCIQPQPTVALPPRMKDNAICDIQYLDLEQGLKSSFVRCIIEDRNGNLWFGTGGYLTKYDGSSFTHYSEKEGLSHNSVRSLMEDRKGNLWVGTRFGGVDCFDGTSFTHFTEKEGLPNNWVVSILEDKNGNLWIGTWGGGVSKYDGTSFTHFTEKEGLSDNTVRSIFEDNDGNLWFGTSGGVCKYDGKSFAHFTEKEGLSDNWVGSILEDKNGNLWFGTSGGISKYDGKSFTHLTEKEGLTNNFVRSILEDSDGNLWFGTFSGVSKYDGTSFTNYTEKEGLSFSEVESILEDKSGNLWIGTPGGGVNRLNRNSFTHYTEKEGLSDYLITSISEDKNENLWFGTMRNGANRYNGQSFTHFTNKEGFFNGNISSILEDKGGNLWISSFYFGINRYDGKMITIFTAKEGLSGNNVNAILEDKNGNLWFATRDGGVSKYDGKAFTNFSDKDGLSNNWINTILEDKGGNLWFGTFGGVSKYDGKAFTNFTEKEGLSDNRVNTIFEDKVGNLWFGTWSGGAIRYDPLANSGQGSFTYYTEKEGLSNNKVRPISEDKSGNMWLGTDKGLNHLIFEKNLISPSIIESKNTKVADGFSIHVYDNSDGLKSMIINNGLIDSKNRAWWGTGKSMVMLVLEKFSRTTKPPVVHLTQLDINEKFIDYQNIPGDLASQINFNGVANFSNYPLDLQLPHELNHLTFHFVGIDWAAPQKIRYSYKLEGLTKNWSLPSAENKADFRNLPYGKFTFKVRALGDSQEWSTPFTYTFTIQPPWWLSWWMYCIYALLLLAAIWQVHLFQKARTIRIERDKAQKKELEQAREIEKAYTELKSTQAQLIQSEKMASLGELTAGIAHEIQNPLNFVNNFSEVSKELAIELKEEVLKSDIDKGLISEIAEDIVQNQDKIHHHGQRASEIVKSMLQHSRSSTGQKELTDINALADEYLRLAYHGLRAKDKSFNADFKTEFDESLPKINVIPQDIGRVLLNLINNAFYAVQAPPPPEGGIKNAQTDYKPTVVVKTSYLPPSGASPDKSGGMRGAVCVSVSDNGPGIPSSIVDKIFQPFFTTKPTGQGTGLGLSLSYDIVKAHGGELKVETKEGEGSEFIIQIPIKND